MAVSTLLAIVNDTAPAVPEFVAILAVMLIENAVLSPMAHVTDVSSASVTVKMLVLVTTAVAVQSVEAVIMVTAIPDPSEKTLLPAVTVIVPAAANAPLPLVVAPNVINVGVADDRRSLARKLALVIWFRTNV